MDYLTNGVIFYIKGHMTVGWQMTTGKSVCSILVSSSCLLTTAPIWIFVSITVGTKCCYGICGLDICSTRQLGRDPFTFLMVATMFFHN